METICDNNSPETVEETVTAPEQQSQIPAAPVQPQAAPEPVVQTVYQPVYQAPAESPNKVVSTGAFFGLEFLFSIPVIGWLVCIIMTFAPKNKNLRHYAQAKLIWLVIGIVLCVGLVLLIAWIGTIAMDYFEAYMDETMIPWESLLEQLGPMGEGSFPEIPGNPNFPDMSGFPNLPGMSQLPSFPMN